MHKATHKISTKKHCFDAQEGRKSQAARLQSCELQVEHPAGAAERLPYSTHAHACVSIVLGKQPTGRKSAPTPKRRKMSKCIGRLLFARPRCSIAQWLAALVLNVITAQLVAYP